MYISITDCIRANKNTPFKGVIHIGAHHGEEIEAYANAGITNVLWVEANQKMMKYLYDKTRVYAVDQQYYCATLSDIDDEVVNFNVANNGQSSSLLELGTHADMYPHINYVEKISVRTQRFDTFALRNNVKINLENYDFVNLDVQGAELKVLKGFGQIFKRYPITAIYTEVNFEHVYKNCCLVEEIDEYLNEFGFQRILTAAPEITWGDALYLRNV